MNKQQPAERKIRVLVVENNVHLRGAYADLIRDFGYEPVVAEGQGTLLAADALHKAKQEQCHLAVVDIRLDESVGGYEIGERGLDIIQAIRPTESIVVTGYQEFRTIKRAYQREQVSEVIQKGAMMPDELCHALAALRDKQWPYVDIGPDDLMALIARQQSQPQRPVSPGEVRDLLMRVFAGEGTVQYTPITNLWKSPVTKAGMRLRSVVLWARPFGKNPCVVKIALKHRAERENEIMTSMCVKNLGATTISTWKPLTFFGISAHRSIACMVLAKNQPPSLHTMLDRPLAQSCNRSATFSARYGYPTTKHASRWPMIHSLNAMIIFGLAMVLRRVCYILRRTDIVLCRCPIR